jgi:hypothetical protein
MADNSNGWHFKHGLKKDFMTELESLAKQGGWFTQVLADPDLILGIRNNYMNVYWHGQSLFKIEPHGKVSTHPKYLLEPALSKAVRFDGTDFQVGGHTALTTHYDGETTLKRMKKASNNYAGDEKKGVHAVIRAPANPNVIDTEVAFNNEAEEENEPLTPRIDLACFEELDGKIRLCFWEAKLYRNDELVAKGDTEAPVVEQIRRYRELIEKHRQEIVDSYRQVARNLAQIARWVTPPRKIGQLVEQVANDVAIPIDAGPFVGLIVYGFDAAQRDSPRWKAHKAKLRDIPIVSAGDAKNIKLRWTHLG